MQFLSLLRSRKITHKAFTGSGGRNAGLLISYNLHMNHEYFRTLRSQLDFFTTYWSDITALCWAESARWVAGVANMTLVSKSFKVIEGVDQIRSNLMELHRKFGFP